MSAMESGRYCVAVTIAPKLAVGYLTLRFTADVFPTVLFDLILEVLPFIELAQSRALDRGHVDEYVFAACLRLINPWPLVGLNHFTVPRTISISQVTIRGDVIQIGDLVARRWRPRHQALPGRPASALNQDKREYGHRSD